MNLAQGLQPDSWRGARGKEAAMLVWQSHQSAVQKNLHKKNILVVNDDPTLCRLWLRLLENLPCNNYLVVSTPLEAMILLANFDLDLLITDLKPSDTSSLELILRAGELNPKLRVLITLESLDHEAMEEIKNTHSFIHLIKKPYHDVTKLMDFVEMLLTDHDEFVRIERDEVQGYHIWNV